MTDHTDLVGLPHAELLKLAPDATHQHFKGGLYREIGPVYDSETGMPLLAKPDEIMILYEHVYPHERQFWVRPFREFYGFKGGVLRFEELER